MANEGWSQSAMSKSVWKHGVDGLKYSKDQSESVTQKQTWDKFAAA